MAIRALLKTNLQCALLDRLPKFNDNRVGIAIWLWRVKSFLLLIIVALFTWTSLPGQQFLSSADTFDRARFLGAAATGAVVYGATIYGLHQAWYEGYERTGFHTFNDWNEWKNMDKAGHLFTAYFESELSYEALRWTGMKTKNAIWLAAGAGMLFQTTVEMFDAYSAKWGFSTYDMIFNLAGAGIFTSQALVWDEQKIRLKISSWPISYSEEPIFATNGAKSSLKERANDLFGKSYAERYLKDYNAQTIWLSANLKSFWPNTNLPKWLNVSIGYGAQNLYGGFDNRWTLQSNDFTLSALEQQRLSQWYLAPDIDLRKIPTDSKFVKALFTVLNVFKMPGPTLEINKKDGLRWHWIFL